MEVFLLLLGAYLVIDMLILRCDERWNQACSNPRALMAFSTRAEGHTRRELLRQRHDGLISLACWP